MTLLSEFIGIRPTGGFGLIMADPPWSFDNYSAAGEGKNAKAHYECQDLDWIKSVPAWALAGKNSLLWMWATHPMLREAIAVVEAWGFELKTSGVWVKRTKHAKESFGTGYVLRSASEPFLLATRGDPKTTKSTRSVISTSDPDGLPPEAFQPLPVITIEARTGAHSEKPDAAYEAAERLMPHARRIELFSRRNRPGWTAWGNEVGKLDDREVAHG